MDNESKANGLRSHVMMRFTLLLQSQLHLKEIEMRAMKQFLTYDANTHTRLFACARFFCHLFLFSTWVGTHLHSSRPLLNVHIYNAYMEITYGICTAKKSKTQSKK